MRTYGTRKYVLHDNSLGNFRRYVFKTPLLADLPARPVDIRTIRFLIYRIFAISRDNHRPQTRLGVLLTRADVLCYYVCIIPRSVANIANRLGLYPPTHLPTDTIIITAGRKWKYFPKKKQKTFS